MLFIFRLLLSLAHFLYGLFHWARRRWKSTLLQLTPDDGGELQPGDLSGLSKLPRHLAVILGHEEPSYFDLARFLGWCVVAGIPCVSLYDHKGFLKYNESLVRKRILSYSPKLIDHLEWKDKTTENSNKTNGYRNKPNKTTEIRLLSYEDGKHEILSLTKSLARAVQDGTLDEKDITIKLLDDKLSFDGMIEPDLAVVCGETMCSYGFLPWHSRITAFLQLPTHHNVSTKDFVHLLKKYSLCKQRYGK